MGFAEQIGLPVPSMPLLLAAGALAGMAAEFSRLAFLRGSPCRNVDSICISLAAAKAYLDPQISLDRIPAFAARRLFSSRASSLLLAKFLPGLRPSPSPSRHLSHGVRAVSCFLTLRESFLWAGSFRREKRVYVSSKARALRWTAQHRISVAISAGSVSVRSWCVRRSLAPRSLVDISINLAAASVSAAISAAFTVDELKKNSDAGEELVVNLRDSMDSNV